MPVPLIKKLSVAGKELELRMHCDIFGKLYISLQKEVDIGKVLVYLLTPVPLSMSHLDGSICKTGKSALLKLLKTEITSETPTNTDITSNNGFFNLNLIKNCQIFLVKF